MNLKQLRIYCRGILSDPSGTLWLDSDLNVYLNEAERQFCRKGFVLRDNLVAVATTALTAGYTVSTRIIDIYRAKVTAATRTMEIRTISEMSGLDWESATTDYDPYILVKMYPSETKCTLYPKPTATSILTYTGFSIGAYLLPAAEMALDTDSPSIASRYHLDMCDYALSMAYSKDGMGTKNPEKEAAFLLKFEKKVDKARREVIKIMGSNAPIFRSLF